MKQNTFRCGIEATLAMIGGKWKFLILWHLSHGPARFGDLRRLIGGISEKMLIQELKQMVADELVSRRDFHEVPPRVEYSVTKFGETLATACEPLCKWGSMHMTRIQKLQCDPVPTTEKPTLALK